MIKRMKPDTRKEQLLNAGISLALTMHYQQITKANLATVADCSMSLVNRHFGTMEVFRKALVSHAIEKENIRVVLQAISCGNAVYEKLPRSLQQKLRPTRYQRG
jgi:hypothetical protein